MLDADTATTIARRHGLSLNDAAALRALADTAEDAERIAERFAGPGEDPASIADRVLGGGR